MRRQADKGGTPARLPRPAGEMKKGRAARTAGRVRAMPSKSTLTEQVYERVYEDVVNGVFVNGQVITENMLIQRYQVSKSPVREALVSLCDEQVLQSIPRTGYQVVRIMPDELLQVQETRQMLEVYMLERSFAHLNDDKIQKLQEYNDRIGSQDPLKTQASKQWSDNMEFHLLLASFSGNAYMCRLLADTFRICARASTQYFLQISDESIWSKRDTHERLIEACRERDIETAKQLLIEDSKKILQVWQNYLNF